jgi:hypothetical protein
VRLIYLEAVCTCGQRNPETTPKQQQEQFVYRKWELNADYTSHQPAAPSKLSWQVAASSLAGVFPGAERVGRTGYAYKLCGSQTSAHFTEPIIRTEVQGAEGQGIIGRQMNWPSSYNRMELLSISATSWHLPSKKSGTSPPPAADVLILVSNWLSHPD